MNRYRDLLMIGGSIFGFLGLLVIVGVMLGLLKIYVPILLLLFVALFYGILLYSYLGYRLGRQEEFLHVLTTAIETGVPLPDALRAYVMDRPHGPAREIWVGTMLFLILPGYYWVWYRRFNFDRKVEALALLLEEGVTLYHALLVTPGLVSQQTLLAVAMGQVTGNMTDCIRSSKPSSLAVLFLEIMPRVLYPLLVLLIMVGCVTFYQIYIMPKMTMIFRDMNAPMPDFTKEVFLYWEPFLQFLLLASCAILLIGLVLLFSSYARWYFPLVARIYRSHARGQVMKMLGVLLELGKPAPEALALLADSECFSGVVVDQLEASVFLVRQGELVSTSLHESGLLSGAMLPLVQAAERAHNLPWALKELGESLSARAPRLLKRLSLLTGPVFIVAVGLLVAFVVLGIFLPLIDLINRNAV